MNDEGRAVPVDEFVIRAENWSGRRKVGFLLSTFPEKEFGKILVRRVVARISLFDQNKDVREIIPKEGDVLFESGI